MRTLWVMLEEGFLNPEEGAVKALTRAVVLAS